MIPHLPLLRIVVEQEFWILLMIIPALYLCYWFYFGITLKMTRKRHRDPVGWILLSFFITPFWVWLLLLIVGEKNNS